MAHINFRLLESHRRQSDYPLFVYDVACQAGQNAIHAHWHEEVEILYANNAGVIEIDAAEIPYKAGDILFVNKERLHKAFAHTDGNFYALLFPYDFLDFKHGDRCQSEILDHLKAGRLLFPAKLTKDHPAYGEIRRCLLDVIVVYFSQTPGRELKIKACLYDILFLCYSKGMFALRDAPEAAPRTHALVYVKAAIAYMEEHFSSPVTMDDLAAHTRIHKNYLNRLFRQATGITPILYLRQLRLEQSLGMLETGATVTQAALASGFNNVSYYIRAFGEAYGISPKQYALEKSKATGEV